MVLYLVASIWVLHLAYIKHFFKACRVN